MSASKRAFEEWCKGFCDLEDIDRPFNGHHHYPSMFQLQELYKQKVEPTFGNAFALSKYNDGAWRCLQIGTVEGMEGIHISTCKNCYDGEDCELDGENQ